MAIANLTALSWRPQYRTSNTPPHRERTPGSARRNSTEASSPRPPHLSGCDVHGREPPVELHHLARILGCPRSGSNGTNTSRSVAAGRQDTRSPATHAVARNTLGLSGPPDILSSAITVASAWAANNCRWPPPEPPPADPAGGRSEATGRRTAFHNTRTDIGFSDIWSCQMFGLPLRWFSLHVREEELDGPWGTRWPT